MKCSQFGECVGEKWDKTYEQSRRIYNTNALSPTIHTCGGGYQEIKVAIMDEKSNAKIRKLTPRECWRLMGFDDSDFGKAAEVCSNSQLYKQAGNSIVVNVLEGILKNLLLNHPHKKSSKEMIEWLDTIL